MPNPLRSLFERRSGAISTSHDLWEALSRGYRSIAGVDVTESTAMQVSAVASCVRLIAGDLASMPVDVIERLSERERRPAVTHPVRRILSQPNSWQTWPEYLAMQSTHVLLRGNGYSVIVRDSATSNGSEQIRELIPMNPDQVTVEQAPWPGLGIKYTWTPTGGDLLTIEAAVLPGKGVLKLTGKLGEVMQESANIALSFVRARAERLGLAPDFLEKVDIHLHVPEGAIPKDGPSAGITLATALISILTGIPARPDLAMTGELTLRGMVLPIGGVKEKLLAAHRMGRKAVLLPAENARHLDEVPAEVREQLSIHLVATMDEVITLALTRRPVPRSAEPAKPPQDQAQTAQ